MSTSTSADCNNTTAASTTSSTRPIFGTNYSNEHIDTHSINMTDSGKAPAYSQGTNGTNGAHSAPSRSAAEPIVKVQPPRREDLQPSYARVIEPDDADADGHGWYGGMVWLPICSYNTTSNTTRSTPSVV